LWWYGLEKLILENENLKIGDRLYKCKNYKEKNQAFYNIRGTILKLNQQNLENELNNLFGSYNINWYEFNDSLCMNWREIQTLNNDSVCTIAGHTKITIMALIN